MWSWRGAAHDVADSQADGKEIDHEKDAGNRIYSIDVPRCHGAVRPGGRSPVECGQHQNKTAVPKIDCQQPLALESAFDPDTGEGTHGEFDAAIMPTAVGTYTFHITGDIKGTAVDVSAASSDSTFNDVKNPSDIQFPVKTPTTQDISAAVTNLQNRLATARSEAAAAKSSAKSAKSTAVIAIMVALVLGLIAIVVGARGRKKAPAA